MPGTGIRQEYLRGYEGTHEGYPYYLQDRDLAIQETARVAKNLICAHMAIAVFRHQAVHHLVDLAQLILIGRASRGCNLHHVAQVGKQLLLDRLLQALVTGIIEGQSLASQRRDANQYLLAEEALGILAHTDLFLD